MSVETLEDITEFFDNLDRQVEDYKKTITQDKENAHRVLTTMNNIFKEFNETGFLDENGKAKNVYWKVIQKDLQDGLILIKHLKSKVPEIEKEPLNVYHIMLGKCLIRLSCLIHEGRIETSEEYCKWIGLYY